MMMEQEQRDKFRETTKSKSLTLKLNARRGKLSDVQDWQHFFSETETKQEKRQF